jgi:hypothetical protein
MFSQSHPAMKTGTRKTILYQKKMAQEKQPVQTA